MIGGGQVLAAPADAESGAQRASFESTRAVATKLNVGVAGPAIEGARNGPADKAQFRQPGPLAVGADGTVYVVDSGNHVVRKITADGVVTTLAGKAGFINGAVDGIGAAATFQCPSAIAVGGDNRVYVVDGALIRVISLDGAVTTMHTTGEARSNWCYEQWGGIVVDHDGSLYVTTSFASEILKISRDGVSVSLSARAGNGFWYLALDSNGDLYSVDSETMIKRISPAGTATLLMDKAKQKPDNPTDNVPKPLYLPCVANGVALGGGGNLYASCNGLIYRITTDGTVTPFAGHNGPDKWGIATWEDGKGAAARFNNPTSLATDAQGNLYVADTGNNLIRKITPDGVVGTFAGKPTPCCTASSVRFEGPEDLAVDAGGTLYVADSGWIRKITRAGVATRFAGVPYFREADQSNDALIMGRIALDGNGNLYAEYRDSTIRKIAPDGTTKPFAGHGVAWGEVPGFGADANGVAASFVGLRGLVADHRGMVVAAEYNPMATGSDSGPGAIHRITPKGTVSTLRDASGHRTQLVDADSIAVNDSGDLYVVGPESQAVAKVTQDGVVTILAGNPNQVGSADGPASLARFDHPSGIAVDPAGNIFVADTNNDTIRKVDPSGNVTTIAGTAGLTGTLDGPSAMAQFTHPTRLFLDHAGNLYVGGDHLVRKIGSDGMVTTVAGRPERWSDTHPVRQVRKICGNTIAVERRGGIDVVNAELLAVERFDASGTPTGALAPKFDSLCGVAVSGDGDTYVGHAGTLSRVTPDGAVSDVVTAEIWDQQDWADASSIGGFTTDQHNNVYLADSGNNMIVKVTPDRHMTILAGAPGTAPAWADGIGDKARFNMPISLAVDNAGIVYVVDSGNCLIRKVTQEGAVTTLAGQAGQCDHLNGASGKTRFRRLQSIAVDGAGFVYVTDDTTIRKISPDGVVTTLAGKTEHRCQRDGIGSAARFWEPSALSMSADGYVYVLDDSRTIRRINQNGVVTTLAANSTAPGKSGLRRRACGQ